MRRAGNAKLTNHPDASEANDPDVKEADIYHPGESKASMCYADAADESEDANCHADTRHSRQIQSRRLVFDRISGHWLCLYQVFSRAQMRISAYEY